MVRLLENVIRGMGTAVDLYPAPRTLVIDEPSWDGSDADMLRHDWQQVGEFLKAAVTHVQDETQEHGEESDAARG